MIRGATNQKLIVETGISLASVETAYISFIRPNKTTGQFEATIPNPSNSIVEYQIEAGDIDISGDWRFFAEIDYLDGRKGFGVPFIVTVKEPGQ